MANNIVELFPSRPRRVVEQHRPRRRGQYHWLGWHLYLGQPGSSWNTEFLIRTSVQTSVWELYCLAEGSAKKKQFIGFHAPQELLNYFNSVDFEVDADDRSLIESISVAKVIPLPRRD